MLTTLYLLSLLATTAVVVVSLVAVRRAVGGRALADQLGAAGGPSVPPGDVVARAA